MTKRFITWDLGATKCRAGIIIADGDNLSCEKTFTIKLTDADSLRDLISRIEDGLHSKHSDVDAVCISAAGQYDDGIIFLEKKYPYDMDFRELPNELNWPTFDVIHDYDSIICATFTSYMNNQNIRMINDGIKKPHARRVAIGVGTGLGVKDGVLLEDDHFWLGKNEMGHIGICQPPLGSPDEIKQDELIAFLQKNNSEPVTFEKILSGRGLVNLHHFYYPNSILKTPEEVGGAMKSGSADKVAASFAWFLGLFIGTLQITFLPEGGVWMTGGVLLHHLSILDHPLFEKGIEATAAFYERRKTYPLGVLLNEEHALIGAGFYAMNRLVCKQHI